MVKKILVCLVLALALGCDDDGSGFPPQPTPSPTPRPICIPNEDLVDSECLAEDLINVCVPFGLCGAEIDTPDGPIAVDFIVPPGNCFATDCETLNCEGSPFVTDLMVTDEDGPILSGSVFIGGEPIPFSPCGPFD